MWSDVFQGFWDLTEWQVTIIVDDRSLGELRDGLLGSQSIILVSLLNQLVVAEASGKGKFLQSQ